MLTNPLPYVILMIAMEEVFFFALFYGSLAERTKNKAQSVEIKVEVDSCARKDNIGMYRV